jgi:hypothetical protein
MGIEKPINNHQQHWPNIITMMLAAPSTPNYQFIKTFRNLFASNKH